MSDCFLDAVIERRSIYHIGKDISGDCQALVKKIEKILTTAPSAFNSQSQRIVILFNENHQKLWQIVADVLSEIVSEEKFAQTQKRLLSFSAGYGTILFYEDTETTQKLQENFPLYKEMFPVWAQQSNGMLQFAIWTLLSENSVGANLQHYNPLIDEEVRREWKLPVSWKLIAEMPFGSIEKSAGEKSFLPLEKRMKIFY